MASFLKIDRNWWFCLVQIKSVIFECFLVVGSQIWRLHVGMSINCHTNNNKTHYKAAPPTGRALKTSENRKTAIFRELQFDWIFYVHALAWQVYCLLCAFFLFYSAWITAFLFSFFFFYVTFTCLQMSPFSLFDVWLFCTPCQRTSLHKQRLCSSSFCMFSLFLPWLWWLINCIALKWVQW